MEDGDLAHEDGDRMMLGKRWWMVEEERRAKDERRRGFVQSNQLIRWLECRLDAGLTRSSS
jgi:hypothetical protein